MTAKKLKTDFSPFPTGKLQKCYLMANIDMSQNKIWWKFSPFLENIDCRKSNKILVKIRTEITKSLDMKAIYGQILTAESNIFSNQCHLFYRFFSCVICWSAGLMTKLVQGKFYFVYYFPLFVSEGSELKLWRLLKEQRLILS